MEHNTTNGTLFACSWVSAVLAKIFIDLSPFWEFIIRSAPLGSTFILYLINYDKVNEKAGEILKNLRRLFRK